MKYRTCFIILFAVLSIPSYAQDSFVKRITIHSEFPFGEIVRGFSVNDKNEDLLGIVGEDGRRIRIGVLNPSGEVIRTLSLIPPVSEINDDPAFSSMTNYIYTDVHHLVVAQSSIELHNDGGRVLTHYNEATATYWSKSFRVSDNFNAYTPLVPTSNLDKLMVGRYTAEEEDPRGLGVSLLDFETGNAIWNRQYWTDEAQSFNMNSATQKKAFPNNFIFSASDYVNHELHLTEIDTLGDTNGELIYQRGYDVVFSLLEVDNNGVVYMMSIEADFENFLYIQILSKTLPDGTIPSCPQYPSCVEVNDIEIQTEPVTWYSGELPPMDDFEVVIGEGDITSFDVCDPLVYPTPDFSLPDTVCQFTCLQPEELNNQLANSVTWQISGPGLDTVVQDTSFQRCFDVPGTYYFDHQVWVLGCFTQQYDTLVVLPDDLYTTIGDTLACGLPLDLYLPASRLLQDAVWAHGAVGVNVQIDTPGSYSFLATDGYCSVSDTIRVSDVYEQYPLPWLSPVDTTICSADFPFRLSAASPYVGTFRLDGLPFTQEAVITSPGNYQLELEISHCTEWTTVQVDTIDCTARIYLPNAFSPNNDGHNDRWFPQGYNFESLQLQIFNRWGGLVYDDRSAAPAWDGRVNGQQAEAGVYLAVLRYYNPLREEEGKMVQEVVVLR